MSFGAFNLRHTRKSYDERNSDLLNLSRKCQAVWEKTCWESGWTTRPVRLGGPRNLQSDFQSMPCFPLTLTKSRRLRHEAFWNISLHLLWSDLDAMIVFERQAPSKSPAEVIVVEPKLAMDELGAEHFPWCLLMFWCFVDLLGFAPTPKKAKKKLVLGHASCSFRCGLPFEIAKERAVSVAIVVWSKGPSFQNKFATCCRTFTCPS